MYSRFSIQKSLFYNFKNWLGATRVVKRCIRCKYPGNQAFAKNNENVLCMAEFIVLDAF